MSVQKKDGETAPLLRVPSVLKERWHIVRKLGGGGFGEIYEGRVAETGETCAVKVESSATLKQVLKMEAAVLRRLQSANCEHACQFLGAGRTDTVNFVVMSLLGPNLSELRKKQPQGKFSWSTTFRLAMQMVAGVQAVHDCGFLHRDIKPSNFVMGSQPNTKHTCYILDFGLARQYVTATGEVREPRPTAGFRGTVRYASISAHRAVELGRHDDLWSLFYLLMEFLHGQLPWRRLKEKEEVAKVKEEFDHNEFLVGLPVEFEMILRHLQRLDYFSCPDYSLLINLFETMIHRYGIPSDGPMDWESGAVADSVPSSSVVSPGAHRDGAVVENAVDGADENGQLAMADKEVVLLNEQDDGTNKTHCSAQENFSGGGKESECGPGGLEEHPSRERDVLHASAEIVVEDRANPEGVCVCGDEAKLEMGVSLNEGEGNCADEHFRDSFAGKSKLVIEAASVEKADLVKEGAVEEGCNCSDDSSCGDVDEAVHLVVGEHELVVNGDDQEASSDHVRVVGQSTAPVLSAHEEEEEEEGAVYPEMIGAADGCKAKESAFDTTAVTRGEEGEAGAECRAVVNLSLSKGGSVGGRSEFGSYGAKQLWDKSCEGDGSGEGNAVLGGESRSTAVSQGSRTGRGECDCGSNGVDGGCHSVSGEGDGVSGEGDGMIGDGVSSEGDGVSSEGDGMGGEGDGVSGKGDGVSGKGDGDSLQERLLRVLAENEASQLAPLATTDSLPPLPTDYDHILRESLWTVTSVGVDHMGTLQLLHDGSKTAHLERSPKAKEHSETKSDGCVEKVSSAAVGESKRCHGSPSQVQLSDGDAEHHTDELGGEGALRPTLEVLACKEPGGSEGVVVCSEGGIIGGSDDGFAAGYSGDEFDEIVSELEDGSSEGEGDTSPQVIDREGHETSEVAVVGQVPLETSYPEPHSNSELIKESPPSNEEAPIIASVHSLEPVTPSSAHSPLPSAPVDSIQKLLGISGLNPWEPMSLPCFPTSGTRPQNRSDPRWKRFSAITSNV